MSFDFEWDNEKNASNIRKHGVSFEDATRVFYDEFSYMAYDDRDYGEDRFQIIGMAYEKILFIVYTERNENTIRIISARRADREESEAYIRNRF